jgi:hypothetical protein
MRTERGGPEQYLGVMCRTHSVTLVELPDGMPRRMSIGIVDCAVSSFNL